MIRVERDQKDAKGVPVKPTGDWESIASAATSRAKVDGSKHVIEEHVYREPRVKSALEQLFHHKCAYCESQVEGFEVEHFRPKGAVSEDATHPGYYWLAYEWSNLYPACMFCNQRRYDQPLWDDDKKLPAAGKATQFPLVPGGRRAHNPDDDLALELPLLLDPCTDDPVEHYSVNPFTGALLPKTERGKATERVFNLNRRRLSKFRAKILQKLLPLLSKEKTLETLERIQSYASDDSPFAGACRVLIRDPRT